MVWEFEFKYIDVFGSFNHGISPSGGTTYFSIYKLSHEFEYQIENSLVMPLFLVIQFVRYIGKEGLKAG